MNWTLRQTLRETVEDAIEKDLIFEKDEAETWKRFYDSLREQLARVLRKFGGLSLHALTVTRRSVLANPTRFDTYISSSGGEARFIISLKDGAIRVT
jgi:hypothetical protein